MFSQFEGSVSVAPCDNNLGSAKLMQALQLVVSGDIPVYVLFYGLGEGIGEHLDKKFPSKCLPMKLYFVA